MWLLIPLAAEQESPNVRCSRREAYRARRQSPEPDSAVDVAEYIALRVPRDFGLIPGKSNIIHIHCIKDHIKYMHGDKLNLSCLREDARLKQITFQALHSPY